MASKAAELVDSQISPLEQGDKNQAPAIKEPREEVSPSVEAEAEDNNSTHGDEKDTLPSAHETTKRAATERSTSEEGETRSNDGEEESEPPLPDGAPPLPDEAPPGEQPDDGWAPVWDDTAQAFYFYNRFTQATQWDNPRVPSATTTQTQLSGPPGVESHTHSSSTLPSTAATTAAPSTPITTAAATITGYNPAVHGDYDPTAWYAQPPDPSSDPSSTTALSVNPATQYAQQAAFNRFTGRFQNAELTPENFNDENKSKRQMAAFFDVDAAANSHDGRSLKAERSNKKLTKNELKQFKEKRKMKKEEKRRAWLRD